MGHQRWTIVAGLWALALVAAGCALVQSGDVAASPSSDAPNFALGDTMTLETQQVAPGDGSAAIDVRLPEGWHVNLDAPPFEATWRVDGAVVQMDAADQSLQVRDPIFPLRVPVTLTNGSAEAQVEVVLYYCNDAQTICTVDRRTVIAPLNVTESAGSSELTISYDVTPPQMP